MRRARWLLLVPICLGMIAVASSNGSTRIAEAPARATSAAGVPSPVLPQVPILSSTTTTADENERDLAVADRTPPAIPAQPDAPTEAASGTTGDDPATAVDSDADVRELNRKRALASFQALQEHFYLPDEELYREIHPYDPDSTIANQYAYLWPLSQTLAALIDIQNLPGLQAHGAGDIPEISDLVDLYWDSKSESPAYASYVLPPHDFGGDTFFDDNAWLGLQLIRAHHLTGDPVALIRADAIFDFMVSGWDTNPSHPAPGGVYWVDSNRNLDRGTVSNATGALLGFQLYTLTTDPEQREYLLEWSMKMYTWVYDHMLAPNGLFWDHIDVEGNIDHNQLSYNQGAALGANVMLYRITADALYLDRAESIAQAALLEFQGKRLNTQPIAYNAIFFRQLLLLYDVNQNPAYLAAMQDYANWVWNTLRDPITNLIQTSDPLRLLDQAAMVELFSALATDPEDYEHMG